MKASPLPAWAAILAILLAAFPASQAAAGNLVVRKSGQRLEGQIVGANGTSLRLEIKQGTSKVKTEIPFSDIQELKMEPPAAYGSAAARLSTGDTKGAIEALQKITNDFAGLDTPWFQRAATLVGDAKLAAGDKAGAKTVYEEFAKTHPKSVTLANLCMARLAIESGDTSGATKLLAPVLEPSAKTSLPDEDAGSSLCQAYYLSGKIKEAEGDKPAALESYLKASALFPFDQNAVADATKRADALRAENPGLIAP